MRNLIAFLRRFRVFLVFMTLQLIALSIYFSFISYPRTKFFNTTNKVSASVLGLRDGITKYLDLKVINEELTQENKELAEKTPEYFISVDKKTAIINDTIHRKSYERIPARVINSTHKHKKNYFTINAGEDRGIEEGMGVISPNGVVGLVYSVSKHYAIVKAIITEDVNISAQLEKSGAHGLIKYDEIDPLRVSLSGISNDIKVYRGEKILTRGSSGYFPPGLLIGKLESRTEIEGMPMWNITVRLAQDMRTLSHIYVIKNIYQLELEELENQIENL